mmetsp:Transcript_4320/g.10541  ORF Transcript_4320/g.10541 Transcript_4320/m.10541 type:complete len:202 (-) Transcript_4320:1017-1622(-)
MESIYGFPSFSPSSVLSIFRRYTPAAIASTLDAMITAKVVPNSPPLPSFSVVKASGATPSPMFCTAVVTPKAVPTSLGSTTNGMQGHITAPKRQSAPPRSTYTDSTLQHWWQLSPYRMNAEKQVMKNTVDRHMKKGRLPRLSTKSPKSGEVNAETRFGIDVMKFASVLLKEKFWVRKLTEVTWKKGNAEMYTVTQENVISQ